MGNAAGSVTNERTRSSGKAVAVASTKSAVGVTKRLITLPIDVARALPPVAIVREARRRRRAGIPQPGFGVSAIVGGALDQLFVSAVRLRTQRAAEREVPRVESEVAAALEVYRREGWLDDPTSFHSEPPSPEVSERHTRVGVRRAISLRYGSGWEPPEGSPGRERWLSHARNSTCAAYVMRRPGPGPWVVCLHGARMGRPAMDAMAFHARELHGMGLNVVLPILPLHGPRRPERGMVGALPAADVMDNIHGMAQATWDVRGLLKWLRAEEATGISLWGTSLGGYVAALTASLEPALASVIVTIPAVDLPRIIASHVPARQRRTAWFRDLDAASKTLHTVVSPLAKVPATPVDRRFIAGARADRVLDPVDQTAALWEHWKRPEILWMSGGHVTSSMSGDSWAFTLEALRRTGQLDAG
jgi:pimeloyl-ACP methyl ester carboxylesterase